ncbi:hypothetical protein U729_3178 (plasmid) [Clostridium baratii str. Sullivan]|uniref:Uncharacterized protein n=1 Tax=Clostridium baratii str. Sullivan TaxID=1415775 RepID=A0A0A7G2I8_9CLOT|nr:hypothetical protein [Clostridium baratii]AIY85231.1 hypothetical protein U729_3178 [Clostridium baratii str. Sullivan]
MGATNFLHEIESESAKKAFRVLVEEANYDYGLQDYNGSINTCSLSGCTMKFDKWSKTNEKKAMKFIEEDEDYGIKWKAQYVDLGVIGFDVRTVKVVNNKNQKAAKLKYVVRTSGTDSFVNSFDKKELANKEALNYSLKHGITCTVKKEYCSKNSSNTDISYTSVQTKRYKTKPKLKDLPNRKIVPIHKYLFYGWASC